MGFYSCCFQSTEKEEVLKQQQQQQSSSKRDRKEGRALVALVSSISFGSDNNRHRTIAEEILQIGGGNGTARVFVLGELAAATDNFNDDCLLGEGGFGKVFKGHLHDTKQDIAVKQLDRNGLQGNREFLVEALMLSLLHHPNLVNLIGYCVDSDQRILVYDYMPLGSLEDHLLELPENGKALDWGTRMKIAQGAAKGLEYLHEVAKPPVIYRDFKASNILLDSEYNARLSDFGLARVGPVGDKSHVSTRVMGTYGYCAPEYAMTGQLTTMSDVYSFGVVFLEIITGRRAIDVVRPSSEQNLILWAEPLFKDKKRFVEMADPLLKGNFPVKGLYQALAIAAMCLQQEASTRPLISDVVTALEYLAVSNDDSVPAGADHEELTARPSSSARHQNSSSQAERRMHGDQQDDLECCNHPQISQDRRREAESMSGGGGAAVAGDGGFCRDDHQEEDEEEEVEGVANTTQH